MLSRMETTMGAFGAPLDPIDQPLADWMPQKVQSLDRAFRVLMTRAMLGQMAQ
jgi:hypothetical protein